MRRLLTKCMHFLFSKSHFTHLFPIPVLIENSSTISNKLVKGNVTHVQRLFPDIPGCFEFNTSGVKMNSVGVFCKEKLAEGTTSSCVAT